MEGVHPFAWYWPRSGQADLPFPSSFLPLRRQLIVWGLNHFWSYQARVFGGKGPRPRVAWACISKNNMSLSVRTSNFVSQTCCCDGLSVPFWTHIGVPFPERSLHIAKVVHLACWWSNHPLLRLQIGTAAGVWQLGVDIVPNTWLDAPYILLFW